VFQYIAERWDQIWFSSWQHFSLVVQCVVLATVIAVVLAALVYRVPGLRSAANEISTIGLTRSSGSTRSRPPSSSRRGASA
jgi:osmoprotectant transport system permease protein